jgi:HK97 family phage prohead protease
MEQRYARLVSSKNTGVIKQLVKKERLYNKENKMKKHLTYENLQIRSSETDGKKYIEGVIPYNSKSVPMWGITEIIDRTAFNKTLADKAEVRAFINHDDSKILGSTKSGTLVLESTDDGLICKCELPNTTYADDLFEIISRGDVNAMSFGFMPIKWLDNGQTRTLKEVKLKEISFGVAFPAYPETFSQTAMRGLKKAMKIIKRTIDFEALNAILEKEELTDDDIKQLTDLVASINEVIGKKDEAEPKEQAEQREENATPEIKEGTSSDKEKEAEELELLKTAIELELIDTDELKKEIEKTKKEE